MREALAHAIYALIQEISILDSEIILLTFLLVIAAIVVDSLSAFAKQKKLESGAPRVTGSISIEGSKELPGKQYISDIQGLAGRPDAVIKENGYYIPIERKPLAKKLHDRYVAQLLVYMRLIEEFEGKKPPYGYLLLGPKCRRIKIENSDARQQWLQTHIDQMREILAGSPAKPAPHPRKCQRCEVRKACTHAMIGAIENSAAKSPPEELVKISKAR